MDSNIVFIVVISVCFIAIILLLVVQHSQAKKANNIKAGDGDTASDDSSVENAKMPGIGETTEEVTEKRVIPEDDFGLHFLLTSVTNRGLAYKKALRAYFTSLTKLDKIYYTTAKEDLANLSEEELEKMFALCRKNIIAFNRVRQLEDTIPRSNAQNVPTYKYLSMIYVIRGEYEKAVNACATAINAGACSDEECLDMKERIYKLSEEGNLEISEKLINLFEEHNLL